MLKMLDRYVGQSFLVTLGITLLVLTFVMSIGAIFRVIDLLAKGISGGFLLRLFLYGMPEALTFSIPVSILVSCLLTFGKFSADGEITAMRACGVSLWQVGLPVLGLALALSVVCLCNNNGVSPRGKYLRRRLLRSLSIEEPIKLLEPGCQIRDFPGMTMWIGAKKGNRLDDIVIHKVEDGDNLVTIRARHGELRISDDKRAVDIMLYDVHYLQTRKEPHRMFLRKYPERIDLDHMEKRRDLTKRPPEMTFRELLARRRNPEASLPSLKAEDLALQVSLVRVEQHKRFVLAFSGLAFAIVAIPLGVRTHRKESSIGVGISILLAFAFFLFVIIGESLRKRPEWHPELIMWVPLILFLWLGVHFIRKAD